MTWNDGRGDHSNLVELLDDRAEHYDDQTFARFPQGELTYQSAAERSRQLAAGLNDLGVGEGQKVGAFMHNHPAYLDLLFATARLGAVLVPVNVALRGDGLVHVCENSDMVATIIGADCLEKYLAERDRLDIDDEVLLKATEDVTGFRTLEDCYLDEGATEEDDATGPVVDRSTSATITYTSGTTGMPKGVVLPHGVYLNSGAELAKDIIQPTGDDRLYIPMPLFHIFAQVTVVEALLAGVPVFLERQFSKSGYWDRIEEQGITITHVSGAIAEMLYKDTQAPDNPVRISFNGIPEDLQEGYSEKFDLEQIPLYGLTEAGPFVSAGTIDNPQRGSIGSATRSKEVAIVDDADNPVPTCEPGEIVVRPIRPYVTFDGYYDAPEQTMEVRRQQWLHTGDVGYLDEDDRLHFVSRKLHFASWKGENVSMFEVERTVDNVDGVAESYAVPVEADDFVGEEILVAVRLEEGAEVTPTVILDYCQTQLAYFKVPRYIRFVDAIPRSETKSSVQRHKLAEIEDAWDRAESDYELEK